MNAINGSEFISAYTILFPRMADNIQDFLALQKIIFAVCLEHRYPDNNVHGTNMGPTWVLLAPDGPHVGPMNLAILVK